MLKLELMKTSPFKNNYIKRLEYSFVLTLAGIISIFYLFPRGEIILSKVANLELPAMVVIEIPRTIQKKLKKTPRPTKPAIPVAAEDIELLDELTIDYKDIVRDGPVLDEGIVAVAIPDRQPRQLVEVVPEEIDEEISGVIVLALKVGVDGSILEHKVVKNSTNNACLQKILQAAYRSRWEPALFRGKTIEFWIEKTYIIN
ncbi:MAG TPA: hypothetical protein EYP36_10635 [Calditrichaeota bacterium]|nr:hypothetical protein [Calditrichota bacterium]